MANIEFIQEMWKGMHATIPEFCINESRLVRQVVSQSVDNGGIVWPCTEDTAELRYSMVSKLNLRRLCIIQPRAIANVGRVGG